MITRCISRPIFKVISRNYTDISVKQFVEIMKGENSKNYQIVDVREPNELEISKLPKDFTVINLPLQSVESWLPKVMEGELLDKTKQIICLCKHGRRGGIVSELLESKAGLKDVHNISGGIHAYSTEIDPSIPIY